MMPTVDAAKESRCPKQMELGSVETSWADYYGTVWSPNGPREESEEENPLEENEDQLNAMKGGKE